MPAYPPLVYGKSSDWIDVRAKPGKELIIIPQATNGDVLFIPKKVQFRFVLFLKFKVFYIRNKDLNQHSQSLIEFSPVFWSLTIKDSHSSR